VPVELGTITATGRGGGRGIPDRERLLRALEHQLARSTGIEDTVSGFLAAGGDREPLGAIALKNLRRFSKSIPPAWSSFQLADQRMPQLFGAGLARHQVGKVVFGGSICRDLYRCEYTQGVR